VPEPGREPVPFEPVPGGVVLRVHVQPGARRSGLAGRHGDAVKLRVAAPAVDGKANAAVLAALAALFGLRPAQVTLVAGPAARAKRVRLDGIDPAAVAAVLAAGGAL
jgi:uncharacterized protein (TIGR00251 family)